MFSNLSIIKLPSKIIFFCICFLPLSLVFSIFISELILLTVIVNFLILNFIDKSSRKYYNIFFFKFFLTFFLILLMATLLSDSISTSIRTSFFYFRFGFLVLAVNYLLEYEKKFLNYFFISLGMTILLLVVYSFLQKFVLFNAYDSNRISGFFNSELIQGSFFLRMLPIFFGLLFLVDLKINKNLVFLFSYVLGMMIILLSGERSAIFLFIILSLLIFLFFPVKFYKKIFFSASILIIFLSSVLISDNIKKRVLFETIDQIFKDNKIFIFSFGHQSHFKSAIEMIKKKPLTGIGPRNYRYECKKKEYEFIGKFRCSTHPHNTYLEIFAETGILGFLFVLIFFLYLIFLLIKIQFTKEKTSSLGFFFFLILILINLFPLVPTGSFFNNWISFLYYLPIGFFLYQKKKLSNI